MKKYKKEYPSICYDCEHCRKPASMENVKNGYTGCSYPIKDGYQNDKGKFYFVKGVEIIGTGWVDLRSRIDAEKGSGIITNCQLITRQVTECEEFMEIQ